MKEHPNQFIHRYLKQLCLQDPRRVVAEQRELERRMRAGYAQYAGQVLRTSFSASVQDHENWEQLSALSEGLYAILVKFIRLYRQHPVIQEIIDLPERARQLILSRPPDRDPLPIARFDCFWNEVPQVLEFNTDSSSGMNDTTEIEAYLMDSPSYQEIARTWPLAPTELNRHVRDVLFQVHRDWKPGAGEPPRVAIVDWKGVKTEPEFRALAEFFAKAGAVTTLADPRELEIAGDELRAAGRPIDLIYKRVLTFELLDRPDVSRTMLEAYERNLYCQLGSMEGEIVYTKLALAALTDPRVQALFTRDEVTFIDRHLPWSRRLAPGLVERNGQQVDMFDLITREKDRFIIKPATAYGGTGVVIGFEADDATWRNAIEDGLGTTTLVQDLVHIPETEELIVEEEPRWVRFKSNLGLFVIGGKFRGIYLRVSEKNVINVSAGGAMVPTFRLRDGE